VHPETVVKRSFARPMFAQRAKKNRLAKEAVLQERFQQKAIS
jgi:hypothetical protein